MASGGRLGLGPVFVYEWLARSRRWQAYALRGLFVLALLVGLGLVYRSAMGSTYLTTRQQMVQAGESFFQTMAIIQLALVLLAAPAATAGAICLDKARGTLAHVMVTDLSDAELVLGKLGARLVPVLNLVACALPVAALGTLLGGIDPVALTASLLIASGLAVLGCSLALALSVWLAKAHEVMTAVYAIWALWLLALPTWAMASVGFWAPTWLKVTNPFWLTLAPINVPGATSIVEPIGFLLACLAISAGLAGLSVARVRPVYLRQSGQMPKAAKDSRLAAWFRHLVRWWPGPSLDLNPVLWREWHRNRPSRSTRIVWGLYIALTSGFSLKIIWDLWMSPPLGRSETAAILNGFQVLIGLLLLSASAGTVLSEERVRGSLDVLLATPLSTRSIVWGKWWGSFRRAPWLAFWPALVTFSYIPAGTSTWEVGMVFLVPVLIVAQGAAVASLGLALATWVSRTGRAVTWTVTALVASTVGWPIVGILLMGGSVDSIAVTIVIFGSPLFNIVIPTNLLDRTAGFSGPMEVGIPIAVVFWTVAYAMAAAGLFLATLLTFDRCLGRTPELPSTGREPRPDGPRRPGQAVRGSGWRTPGAAGRPAASASNSAPPPR